MGKDAGRVEAVSKGDGKGHKGDSGKDNRPDHLFHQAFGHQFPPIAHPLHPVVHHPKTIDDLTPAQRKREEKHEAFIRGGKDCHGMWTHLIGRMVTSNETSHKKFDSYTANDAGHGISVGLLQFNQQKGSLPDLLRAWHHKDPDKFDHMFGKYSKSVLSTNFVKSADFNNNPILHKGILSALQDREFDSVQLSLRDRQAAHSCSIAVRNGFHSFHSWALTADIANQTGDGGARHALKKVPHFKSEVKRIDFLEDITSWRPHGDERAEKIESKVNKTWAKLGHSLLG